MMAPSDFGRMRKWAGLILSCAALGTGLPSLGEDANPEAGAPVPRFSLPGGVYTTNITVRLTSDSPAATIRYTLDRSEPTGKSSLFSEALVLTNSALVRARVFRPSQPPGPSVSQNYTLAEENVLTFSSNLPLVILDAYGQQVVHGMKVPAALRIIDAGEGRSSLAGKPNFEGRALINLRGRASLRYPKNSLTVKTVDELDDPLKVSLLGFPRHSDWVLYAPYPDKTLMRDVLAYELSNRMGRYAPRTGYVEVFVTENGRRLTRRDYAGVYVLEEKIKRGNGRVEVKKLGPEDCAEPELTGGYIFKKDHSSSGDMGQANAGGFPGFQGGSSTRIGFPTGPGGFPADPKGFLPALKGSSSSREESSSRTRSSSRGGAVTNRIGMPTRREQPVVDRGEEGVEDDEIPSFGEGFKTSQTNRFFYVEPELDEITSVQKAWLEAYLNRFERALYGPKFIDPEQGYGAFIDAGSFIDYHLIVELTKNVDGFRFSTFFQKDRGNKIKMGPLWDWNLSFGNANGKQGWMPEYWLWPQLDDQQYAWFRRLFEDPDFGQKYVDRWSQLRTNQVATSNLLARIDQMAVLLQESQARNFERWPILGRSIHPNYYVGNSYDEEVSWMKNWVAARLAWMDQQFLVAPYLLPREIAPDPRSPVGLAAPIGSIYYTIDGTDPRLAGGAVSSKASPYSVPVRLDENAKLMARARHEGRWSGPTMIQPWRLPRPTN